MTLNSWGQDLPCLGVWIGNKPLGLRGGAGETGGDPRCPQHRESRLLEPPEPGKGPRVWCTHSPVRSAPMGPGEQGIAPAQGTPATPPICPLPHGWEQSLFQLHTDREPPGWEGVSLGGHYAPLGSQGVLTGEGARGFQALICDIQPVVRACTKSQPAVPMGTALYIPVGGRRALGP